MLSLIWVFVWLWYFHDVPATPPLNAEELATLPTRSRGTASEPAPRLKFHRMLPVTAVDFCYGWTLWLFLNWIPSFFYQNYQQNLMQSSFYSAADFLAWCPRASLSEDLGLLAREAATAPISATFSRHLTFRSRLHRAPFR
jgi:hypothetical protein